MNSKRRRQILIVEDNDLNREILSSLLEDEYDILAAADGAQGFSVLAENYRDIAVVLLDVYMPVMNGFEFLAKVRDDELLSQIPIIVATGSDKPEDEAKCLDMGASDFVTKPYNPRVVLGRIRSIIKLRESVATLSAVEYDPLTGVMTMPAFTHYAERMMSAETDMAYDLVVVDLQEFKLINGSFGRKKGDATLKYIGQLLLDIFSDAIIARQADKFYCMFASGKNEVDVIVDRCRDRISKESPIPTLVVKFGYYPNVEKAQPASILCDRVVMAVTSIKDDFMKFFAVYDDKISQKRIAEQRMEASFDAAIQNREFVVWFQPKVDCRTEQIVAAEALVRWRDSQGGFVSPGLFIPLFERDGLISTLDTYVFRSVCEYQKARIDSGRRVFPISVNLSRNSIYHGGTVAEYLDIVKEIGVPIELVPIELTESAATGGHRIQNLAQSLVKEGFNLHMDDFGSGYSSLSSLSVLPFDVIKLDKSLTDQIGTEKGDIVVRHIIEIVHEMGLEAVVEGVETNDQATFLKRLRCDMIQGYFYSAPKSQEVFDEMLEKEKPFER